MPSLTSLAFRAATALTLATALLHAEIASYQEIPYYLRQLQETDLESKRMECNKIIHDAVVNANLSDKKTVKKMEPIIEKIQVAMDSGFDRAYLEGASMWLGSAVAYFEREKNRRWIAVPAAERLSDQTVALDGARISIYPEKILLHKNGETKTAAESAGIHEAIISPDGKRAAFFRKSEDAPAAEVWVVNLKNFKRKKIAALSSCETLLFSDDGSVLFLQEKPATSGAESPVHRISASGGKIKRIGQARALDGVVVKGKNKGALIVYRTTPHHMGATQLDCPVAWNPSGEELGRLKDEACR